MPQKTKIVIFFLGALLLVSLFLNYQTHTAKQTVEREKESVKKENAALAKKIEEGIQENKRLNEKIGALNQDLEKFSKDKEDIQIKYDSLKDERDALVQKLREQVEEVKKAQEAAASQQNQQAEVSATPKTDDVFWANLLKTKAGLEIQLDSVRRELASIKITGDQLQREKSSFELEVSSLNNENQDLKRQLDYSQKVVDRITKELVTEKTDKFQMQSSFKTLKGEDAVVRQQLKSLINHKANLERKLTELQSKYGNLQDNISKMEVLLKDKMLQFEDLQKNLDQAGSAEDQAQDKKGSVELPPIVVRPQKDGSDSKASKMLAQGKVLLVNRDNNFVIINLGEDSGIKIGDTLQVYRQGQFVAQIKAIQARRGITACDIIKESMPVKVGDILR
jgi:chromosome segregation ATPase